MGRRHLFSGLILVIACLDAATATAADPPAATLEAEARAEFAKVGLAVRERLEREAAGDVIGARVAEQNADAHRYRFLDIQRELTRLRLPSRPSPSVEARRDPFVPDASFAASASSGGSAPATGTRQEAAERVAYPAWDMYRPHELRDGADAETARQHSEARAMPTEAPSRGGDMYSKGLARPKSSEPDAKASDVSASPLPAEPPREPFLVYRASPASGDPRD